MFIWLLKNITVIIVLLLKCIFYLLYILSDFSIRGSTLLKKIYSNIQSIDSNDSLKHLIVEITIELIT